MPAWEIVVMIAVTLVAAAVAWVLIRRNQTRHLRERFGPEYDRAIEAHGNRDHAEKELARREKHVDRLHLRTLGPGERDRFVQQWRADQTRFVDDPAAAVTDADRLITEVMKSRGYPVADFEQRVKDISVGHADLVQNYRAACEIASRHRQGESSTEDLRRAMVGFTAISAIPCGLAKAKAGAAHVLSEGQGTRSG
jgi:hypothetical protein